jgi:hypothetical protein
MKNKHLYLNNKKNQQNSFNRKRGFSQKEPEHEVEELKIKEFQVTNLRNYYIDFTQSYKNRYKNRTIEFPSYIDLIEIRFFPIFGKDLKNKFFQKYGLFPISYKDFNRTVVLEVVDKKLFDDFKSDIEFIISQVEDVPYSNEDFNIIATIYKFRFINKRSKTNEKEAIILSFIQSASIEISNLQKIRLKQFLNEANLSFSPNVSDDLFYIESVSNEILLSLEHNFDIIQSITSTRAINVRPGMLGTLRMNYGFDVLIPENLTTVGIIDTGINTIEPFNNLVVDDGINITGDVS